jgi:hypothetical protein
MVATDSNAGRAIRPGAGRKPAPSIYAIPLELQLLAAILTPRTREAWRALPLEALPPHAGPVLVFDVFDQAPATWIDDWSGRTLQSNLELDELVADQLKLARTAEPMERAKLAKRIRRRWVALVDHAIGYRVPGTLDVLEFAR